MNGRTPIWKGCITICCLLCIQLAARSMPTLKMGHLPFLQEVNLLQGQLDSWQNQATEIECVKTSDRNKFPVMHAIKHRRKTRYCISAHALQISAPTRIAYLVNGNIEQSINENKTGKYIRHKSFLPAYYDFLFRFTPF